MTHPEVEDWLVRALEADTGERTRIREEASKALSRASMAEFESLLQGVERSPEFLAEPVEIASLRAEEGLGDCDPGQQTPELKPGLSVGGYVIRGLLGQGASSRVYDAEQDVPRRRIALKILRDALDERGARRFREEAETLARLDHPHIARVLDAGVERHELPGGSAVLFWTALEQVREAETVTDFAERKALSVEQRIELALQICEALHHAHRRGVLHRDVKPANVLVPASGEGGARLIDFGIARTSAFPRGTDLERTREGDLLGSLPWMSPEHASGRHSTLDVRSDVYSLGVVLWELFLGRRPLDLEGLGLVDALDEIRDGDRDPEGFLERDLDADLAAVLRKCVERDPELRYDSVLELAEDLRAFREGRPVAARKPGWFRRLRLYAKRRPGVVTGVALASVAVIGFSIAMTMLWLESSDRARRLTLAEQQRVEAESREERARARASTLLADLRALGTEGGGILQSFVEGVQNGVRSADDREARRELISSAIAELEELVDGPLAETFSGQLILARALLRVGALHGSEWNARGADVAASARAFQQASQLWRKVVATDPEEPSYRRMLVESLVEWVQSARKLRRQKEAFDDADEAVEVARELVAEQPTLEHRRLLISALWTRGDVRIWNPPYDQALLDTREALELSRQLMKELPADGGGAKHVAWSAMRMALWKMPMGADLLQILTLNRECTEAAVRYYELSGQSASAGIDLSMFALYEVETLGKLERFDDLWALFERVETVLEKHRSDPRVAVRFLFTCDSIRHWMTIASQQERVDEVLRLARARVESAGTEEVSAALQQALPEVPKEVNVFAMLGRMGVQDLVTFSRR